MTPPAQPSRIQALPADADAGAHRRRLLQAGAGLLLLGAGLGALRPARAGSELSVGLDELRTALSDRRTVVFDQYRAGKQTSAEAETLIRETAVSRAVN